MILLTSECYGLCCPCAFPKETVASAASGLFGQNCSFPGPAAAELCWQGQEGGMFVTVPSSWKESQKRSSKDQF